MTHDASGEYLKNAVMTATPEQLQLMLYDGAIRFARQAKDALAKRDLEKSCEKLLKAQRIIAEMQNGLRHDVNPTLCAQMAGVYGFIHDRLVHANMKQNSAAIDEALTVLEHQRETWVMLLDKLKSEAASPGSAAAQAPPSVQSQDRPQRQKPDVESRVGGCLSVEG